MGMIVGIDPGVGGALCSMEDDGTIDELINMPTIKDGKNTLVDCDKLADWIRPLGRQTNLVVLEKVGARPGQGACSGFSFGRTLGRIEGVLIAMNFRYEFPTPQRWKKVVLEGTDKSKEAAIAYVRRRWPDAQLIPDGCRVPHDGRAEAILLAEFGRRLLRGKP